MNQEDTDGDGIGDVCDDCTGTDKDGYGNPGFPNNCSLETFQMTQRIEIGSDHPDDIYDNCFETPNGYKLGTCAKVIGGVVEGTGDICTYGGCEDDEFCEMDQLDLNENGIGDVCECLADGNEDGWVINADYIIWTNEFGRGDCPSCD